MKKILSLIIILLVSCNTNDSQVQDPLDGITEGDFDEAHPLPEYMPYHDFEADEIGLNQNLSSVNLPPPLELLREFVENDERYTEREITFLASDNTFFDAASISDNQLLLLDERKHSLAQYNIDENSYEIIAPEGRGPGDLFFPKEVQLFDNKLYIPMGGYRISVFDCESKPCEYIRTLDTGLNNYSITKNEDQLTILAQPVFTGQEEDRESYLEQDNSIYKIDPEGETLKSFMPIYDNENPILRSNMSSEGSLRSFGNHDIYTVIMSRLPYLYIFDYNSAELTHKYELPDYTQGFVDIVSDSPMGVSTDRHNDQSYFTQTTKIDDEWLLITKRERKNTDTEMRGMDADESYIYFGFNTKSHDLYKIGKEPYLPMDDQRTITVTDHGLVINEQGSLYWVNYSQ